MIKVSVILFLLFRKELNVLFFIFYLVYLPYFQTPLLIKIEINPQNANMKRVES